jgi:murein DD-endopeptidase MepM/ murein hydrolase activator NlpD
MLKVSPVTGQEDYPGTGWTITSKYAKQAYFDRFGAWHTGHDLAKSAQGGEPIYAAADGIVKFAAFVGDDGFGNLIFIKHNDNLFTRYGHLREIHVKRNQPVKAGEVIGLLGTTGRSTGNHLHFDAMLHSNALDWPGTERTRLLKQYIDPEVWFAKEPFTVTLLDPLPTEKMRVIAPAGLNVRQTPRRNGIKISLLMFGSIVDVKPLRVEASGLAWRELVSGGWVAEKYLEPISAADSD